ncbi:MAG: phospholipase D-like domain-containing protein [Ignavibacteria bacterium]|nr:phospholipase D-like domain-containing protein [Ignavibacteria bacterium]
MKKYLVVLYCFLIGNLYSQVVPIASIRMNDANGVPLLLNQTRTVTGVVTAKFGYMQSFLQDNTAGICAYDSNFTSSVQIGDSVIVTGVIVHFNGLTEFTPVTNFSIVGTGKTVNPVVINLQQFTNQQWNGLEQYESVLIRFNGVTINASGNFQGNTNYSVTDATGTYPNTLRISTYTNIVGTLIPQTPVDIIAIGSQYKTSPPYNSGYQFLPRSTSDFILPGPGINSIPIETNITQTSVTINWTTTTAGDSKIKYFVSDSLYQPVVYTDSVYNPAMVTNHSLTLNNLKPGTIYYAHISSTNSNGTSVYVPKYFATSSHSSSTGKMELYFNFSVDTSIAYPNNKATGNVDLKNRLIHRIDSAQYSIDIALYSFDNITLIRDKLINAFARGVKIRIVYDYRDGVVQPLMQDLINAGIPVQIRPQNSSGYLMHNKFFIFDSRDTSSYSDDWLWFGSANITNQQFYSDYQNVLLIQDETLCKIYTREFEEMWGSHNNVNNPALAKFGPQKLDNTPHILNINGRRYECYFSPSDNVSTVIENLILNETHKSINFCIFAFTRFQIANRMKTKYNPPNVMVRGVFDYENNYNNNLYLEMKGIGGTYPWNPPARVYLEPYSGLLHHKYIILDPELASSSPIVITGSYNFTNNATIGNDENIFVIYDSLMANKYFQEFSKRISESGGSIGVQNISSNVPEKFHLNQNYPNPFNSNTIIEFDLPQSTLATLKVYDISGRLVKQLFSEFLNAGSYKINFNAENISSGIYLYTLETTSTRITKKMIVIK